MGAGWSVLQQLGEGGTASVFEVASPGGPRALKLYSVAFSAGEKGEIENKRISVQIALKDHDCLSLVQVYDGGKFEDRLFVLMSRAPGKELAKRLQEVPRDKIRRIVDQVARAVLFLQSQDLCHRDIKAENIFVSDDFSEAVLLDVSVIRNIYDPIGVGTDHENQLPVVATARYSPPEYLFRLLAPGPELWHGLSVYQLGGLLHDLIMRQPLFEAEYRETTTNRYRFAWVVATVNPVLEADDVDQDLVFTARRAMDKNWERRSSLRLEDFLADVAVQQMQALRFAGLAGDITPLMSTETLAGRLERLRAIASMLEQAVLERLRRRHVIATHDDIPGLDDTSRRILFRWDPSVSGADPHVTSMDLELTLRLVRGPEQYFFTSMIELRARVSGRLRTASLSVPDVADEIGAEAILANHVEASISALAVKLTEVQAAT
jgi:serine/threonine-protein kinase